MEKYKKYLGKKHNYLNTNCITLIAEIYENELQRDDFKKIWEFVDLKEGHPEQESRWWKFFTLKKLLKCAKEYGIKIEKITDIEEYDFIIFTTKKRKIPIHFGMYIGQNMMIHIEEGSYSKIDMLNDSWRERIHSVYRRKMV
jgi:hypothetical protein|tara:strand:+ start:514 stop:939 length:426 start_codon:yes stop_codon:yes gene_type:complete